MEGTEPESPPNQARAFDYYVGGTDHSSVDREFAAEVDTVLPAMRDLCRSHRRFSWAAVEHLCRAGVRQFLELGSGLPTVDHIHTHAGRHHPDRRVVYVDSDPVVVTHAETLLRDVGGVAVLRADVADAGTVMGSDAVAGTLDLARPVAVLACGVLHYVDDRRASAALTAYRDAVGPGSWRAISHLTADGGRDDLVEWAQHHHAGWSYAPLLRSAPEMDPWLDGFDPVGAGWVSAPDWRPEPSAPSAAETGSGMWGVVARRR